MSIRAWWQRIEWPWVRKVGLCCVYDGPDYLMLFWLTRGTT